MARQLSGFSSLFSFELDTEDPAEIRRFVNALQRFRIGISWGGVESLVFAPNSGDNAGALEAQHIPPGTVRISVGLEGVDVLSGDLDRALGAM